MNSIIGVSKLSSKLQITIPKDVRELLEVGPGDKIVFVKEEERIIVKKA